MIFDSDVHKAAGELFPKLFVENDPRGHILWANQMLERTFGYDYGSLVGQPVEVLVPEKFRSMHVSYRTTVTSDVIGELMAGGREVCGRKRDGSDIQVRIRLARATISGVDGVLGIVFDMGNGITSNGAHKP